MATHPNAQLIERFYSAFAKRDAETMVSCYAPDATFSDPVFPDLRGPQVGAMWRMLTGRSTGLELEFSGIQADDQRGAAHWEAKYTFSATGRKVHNIIDASFQFRDGLIVAHQDRFDLWRWTRMALGPKGVLLGWSPLVQGVVRKNAAAALAQFMAKSP